MSQPPTLPERMRARANEKGYAADHPLRTLAQALDDTIDGCYGDPQTKTPRQLLGAWARARKAWCDDTGEPLI